MRSIHTGLRSCAVVAGVVAIMLPGTILSAQKKKSDAEKAVPSYYGPQPPVESLDMNMYQRIREEGLMHGKAMDLIGALSDDIGPRLTGSPNLARGYDWAVAT